MEYPSKEQRVASNNKKRDQHRAGTQLFDQIEAHEFGSLFWIQTRLEGR